MTGHVYHSTLAYTTMSIHLPFPLSLLIKWTTKLQISPSFEAVCIPRTVLFRKIMPWLELSCYFHSSELLNLEIHSAVCADFKCAFLLLQNILRFLNSKSVITKLNFGVLTLVIQLCGSNHSRYLWAANIWKFRILSNMWIYMVFFLNHALIGIVKPL